MNMGENNAISVKPTADKGALYSTILEMKELWYNPPTEVMGKDWIKSCFEGAITSIADLACNPSFMECFFANAQQYKNHGVTTVDYAQYATVSFEVQDNRYTLKLTKNCHEVELPKNIYSAGTLKDESQLVWDNYLYKIFVDKYYVSEHDVYLWARRVGNSQLLSKLQKVFRPAFQLSMAQRNQYCQDQGKFLLESRVFDAGSFYPSSDQLNFKSEVPWTKSTRHFLNNNEKMTEADCKDAYVQGCQRFFSWSNKIDIGLTWIGIRHGLGSYAEVFRNTYNSRANLKISNLALPKDHPEHRLGRRSNWEEANYSELEIEKVAFRCMRLE